METPQPEQPVEITSQTDPAVVLNHIIDRYFGGIYRTFLVDERKITEPTPFIERMHDFLRLLDIQILFGVNWKHQADPAVWKGERSAGTIMFEALVQTLTSAGMNLDVLNKNRTRKIKKRRLPNPRQFANLSDEEVIMYHQAYVDFLSFNKKADLGRLMDHTMSANNGLAGYHQVLDAMK